MKPDNKNPEKNKKEAAIPVSLQDQVNDPLRTNLAIGTTTLFISIFFLALLNYIIYSNYSPDINAILDKLVAISFVPRRMFSPEPVERMQFQLSIILAPFIIFGVYSLINKKKSIFNNQSVALAINVLGLVAFVLFTFLVFTKDLLYVENETTTYFFANNLIRLVNPIIDIVLFCFLTGLLYFYQKSNDTPLKKIVVNLVSYIIVSVVVLDIVLYNVYHLGAQDNNGLVETNAVL